MRWGKRLNWIKQSDRWFSESPHEKRETDTIRMTRGWKTILIAFPNPRLGLSYIFQYIESISDKTGKFPEISLVDSITRA